jgi:cytochrome c oxidase subunit II
MPACHGRRVPARHSSFGPRVIMFVSIAVLVIAAAVLLLSPQRTASAADQTVEVTMAGFQPGNLTIAAGTATTVRLVNPDSPYHSDGGGVHQFASPELGIDVKVQPRSDTTFTIPALQPGTYRFYCDVCCGGKENPSMQGMIVVS